MDDTYYSATRTVRVISASTVGVYMGSVYGLPKPGDLLDLRIYDVDAPERVFKETKLVTKRGSSCCITFDYRWGFSANDIVVVEYRFCNRNAEDAYAGTDSGRR